MIKNVRRYSAFIQHILDTDIFTPGDASRMVGKIGFAVSTAADRQGRTLMKIMYAQIYSPMPHLRLSTWARHCLKWWKVYFAQSSDVWCSTREDRKTVISWTDAAGDGYTAAKTQTVAVRIIATTRKPQDSGV